MDKGFRIPAEFDGSHSGTFKTDEGKEREYHNHYFNVMGGRIKVRAADVDPPSSLKQGEACELVFGSYRIAKDGAVQPVPTEIVTASNLKVANG